MMTAADTRQVSDLLFPFSLSAIRIIKYEIKDLKALYEYKEIICLKIFYF
jgi:hypothetical protein